MNTRLLFLLTLIGLMVAACGPSQALDESAVLTSTPPPTLAAQAAPTVRVQRGDVVETLEFQGRWLTRDQDRLAFESGGRVRRVLVQRGDAVTAGQLLADLDITELENNLANAMHDLEAAQEAAGQSVTGGVQSVEDAEIALANARLTLETTRLNTPWSEAQTAAANLQTAQRNLQQAQRSYDDVVSRPDSSPSAVDGAYQALLAAQDALRTAERAVSDTAQSWTHYDISVRQAENAVRQSEINLERARQGGTGSTSPEAARALRQAQMRVEQIEAEIARASLYTPVDGVVLEVTIQPGAQVEAYTTVITIGRPEPLEAIATLGFADVQRLSMGVIGECEVHNQPDTRVQCIVRRLPLTAQDADQTVRIAATLPMAQQGQLIRVVLPLQTSNDTLFLPPQAVRTFQSRVFVVLQTPEGQRRADVQVGLRTDERVEILSGVSEWDEVVLP